MCLKAGAIFQGEKGSNCPSRLSLGINELRLTRFWIRRLSLIAHCFLSGKQQQSVAWNNCQRTGEVSLGTRRMELLSLETETGLEIQNFSVPFKSLLLNSPLNLWYDTQREKGVPFPHLILIYPGSIFLYLFLEFLFFSFGFKTTWAHFLIGHCDGSIPGLGNKLWAILIVLTLDIKTHNFYPRWAQWLNLVSWSALCVSSSHSNYTVHLAARPNVWWMIAPQCSINIKYSNTWNIKLGKDDA